MDQKYDQQDRLEPLSPLGYMAGQTSKLIFILFLYPFFNVCRVFNVYPFFHVYHMIFLESSAFSFDFFKNLSFSYITFISYFIEIYLVFLSSYIILVLLSTFTSIRQK